MDNMTKVSPEDFLKHLALLKESLDADAPMEPDPEYEERRCRELTRYMREGLVDSVKRMIGPRHADCTFENFEVNDNNRAALERCRLLADTFERGCKGVLLCGTNGIGKNHLAAATAKEVAFGERNVFYGSITAIKNRIYDAMDGSLSGAVDTILHASLICINDLGAEQDTQFGRELMFHLIDRMYEKKSVLLATTNILRDSDLGKRYGDRVLSRLLGMCDVLVFDDEDHRIGR
jgi:DNA replication protein DnaC